MTQDLDAQRFRALRLLGEQRPGPGNRDADGPVTLSDLQQSLWIEQKLNPESAAYTSALALEILSPVDPAEWCGALERVISRMPFLNVIYPEADDGGPSLRSVDARFAIPIRDAELPEGADLGQLAWQRVGGAFDLTRASPVRAVFERLTPERAVLWLAAHHIAWDGGALRRLLALWQEELSRGALPRTGAMAIPAAPNPGRHADLRAEAEVFFADADPAAEFALAPGTSDATAFHICDVDSQLVRGIERCANDSGVSLQTVFVAGLAAVAGLQSLCGLPVTLLVQDRAATGFGLHRVIMPLPAIAARSLSQLIPLCHTAIGTALGLTALPEADQRAAFRAATGQHEVPLGRCLFSFDSEPKPPETLAGVPVRFHVAPPRAARAPLGLSVLMPKAGGQVQLRVEAAETAQGPQDVADFAQRYLETLSVLIADPERPVAKLPPTRMPARRRLSLALRGAPLGTAARMSDLLRTLEANPLALIDRARLYSGQDLRRATESWVIRLAAAGVGEGDRVILALPRGLASASALLALWHLGAAPILADPDTKAGAIVASLCAAAPRAGIADRDAALATAFQPAGYVWLKPQEQIASGPVPAPAESDAARPAYLVMTSGSTGFPAMVEISHGNLAATLAAASSFPEMPKRPRTVWSARLAFDISVLEFLLPLVLGGTAVVHQGDPPDIETLAREAAEADIFHAVPAVMAQVIETEAARAAGPRLALVGGDRVPCNLLKRMRAVWSDSALRVLYGPSETTIIVLSELVTNGPQGGVIGRPHPGVRLRIVDAQGRSVPPGMAGELWIGGPVVGRYYDGGNARAGRFVTRGGRRFFRSGDLVRLDAQDRIVFLGRLDSQEKIDGVRVDPEAIEILLRAQPGIAEAVVTGYDTSSGRRRLAAFYTKAPGATAPPSSTLRQALTAHLPRAAVPAQVTPLEHFVLNRNGKIDRKALRQRAEADEPRRSGKAMTDLQATVATAAQEVLGQPIPDADRNLLGLGADSIALARINRKLGALLGKTVPLTQLMAVPTVAGIAAALSARRSGPLVDRPPPLIAPATTQQQLLYQIEELVPIAPQATIPAAFEVEPPIPFEVLRRSFLKCLAACDGFGLCMRADPEGLWLKRLTSETLTARAEIEEVALPDVASAEAPLKVFFARRFDLGQGPLVRILSLLLGSRQILVLNAHHIVADGWALHLFLERLLTDTAVPPDTPVPPEPSYLAYAEGQADSATDDAFAYLRHLDQTGGQAVALFRPSAEKERPDFVAKRAVRNLVGVGSGLDALAADLAVTPVSIGLTAFAAAIADAVHVPVPRIAMMCPNRDAPGTANLIGLTANTLLIDPLNGSDTAGPDGAIRTTQSRLEQSLAFQHVPVQDLSKQAVARGQDPEAYSSRFQFSYTDTTLLHLTCEGTTLSALPEPEGWQPNGPIFRLTAYDLALDMIRSGKDIRLVATYLTDVMSPDAVAAILDNVVAWLGPLPS